jgi:hypothetical protein
MKRRKIVHGLLASILLTLIASAQVIADCVRMPEGKIVKVESVSCKKIVAEKNEEVRKYAGDLSETSNLKKAYTGALITDKTGARWMYPSADPNPCKGIKRGTVLEKKAYYTCCDTGRWGKCVFGGNWLGDVDGNSINSFQ